MRELLDSEFPKGVLRPELFLGLVASVTPQGVGVNLAEAGRPSGAHYAGGRYGRGEVGEYVLIEGQQALVLGRIREVRLHEPERRAVRGDFAGSPNLDVLGVVQLLGTVAADDLRVTPGVASYPRIGDRIYSAPHRFLASIPRLMSGAESHDDRVELEIGTVGDLRESMVRIEPEKLCGRHCAILGATGGGKSWTTARLIEECVLHGAKVVLIDATGEYRGLTGTGIVHRHLGTPVATAQGSQDSFLPPTGFLESDFVALFEPAGKVQGPKLRAAIRSLRLAGLNPAVANEGIIEKCGKLKAPVETAERAEGTDQLDDPRTPFDVRKLPAQIEEECVFPQAFQGSGSNRRSDPSRWGDRDDASVSYCLALITRIAGILASQAFSCVFGANATPERSIAKATDEFVSQGDRLLRICLSGVAHEYRVREIVANAIGRHMLTMARRGDFHECPVLVVVDEAHNFLGRHIGGEDYVAKLDAFELIAREGRKYGITLCLASQRPRDITEGVLSQMGTLIVHRLTNDRDREVVERACGEIDRSATAFLPNLRPGEAAIVGVDFPIPLTLQVRPPSAKPHSAGPDYQTHWKKPPEPEEGSTAIGAVAG